MCLLGDFNYNRLLPGTEEDLAYLCSERELETGLALCAGLTGHIIVWAMVLLYGAAHIKVRQKAVW